MIARRRMARHRSASTSVGFGSDAPGHLSRMALARKKAQPKKFTTVVRDAVSGRFLPKSAAKRRPKTTVTQRVRLGRRGKKK